MIRVSVHVLSWVTEWVMYQSRWRCLLFLAVLSLFPTFNAKGGAPQNPTQPTLAAGAGDLVFGSADAEIYVKAPNGAPIDRPVVVTLLRVDGQVFGQETTKGGLAKFDRLPYSEFKAQVVASGYQMVSKSFEVNKAGTITVTLNLQLVDAEEAASSAGFYTLAPKVQKDVGKVLAALHANKPNDALHPLEAAEKNAPNNAEIEYLFGLYSSQLKNDAEAQAHWKKAVGLNPKHLGALLSLGNGLLQEKKPEEAMPYLNRAVEVEPASWRAHALLGEALALEKKNDEAEKEAERAMELGHERAASAQLILARAEAQRGERDKAIATLQSYLKTHPNDAETAKTLDSLRAPAIGGATVELPADELGIAGADAAAIPIANWRPADVDEHIPSVDAAASCPVDDVVEKAGKRLMELMSDVDRFSATESLVHESINKWGMPTDLQKRKFDYVVSIQLLQGRYLDVEEYRNGTGGSAVDFPGGVATNGLPALVLIFHPTNAMNFDMTCEGLSKRSSGLAWQVHFKQRNDRPNTVRRYRLGVDGPSYPVALKGRAWISAETYQIVRMETDLVAPIPEIRLFADHTEVEYGPVKFKDGKVNMWLPQSAEIFYDWKGQRIHRRHSFSNYLLFAVDERQKISPPKTDDAAAATGPVSPSQKP
jgi:tetratricopeptide (TPR) repeat protein